jgi:hypothetical protein
VKLDCHSPENRAHEDTNGIIIGKCIAALLITDLCCYHFVADFSMDQISIIDHSSSLRQIFNLRVTAHLAPLTQIHASNVYNKFTVSPLL